MDSPFVYNKFVTGSDFVSRTTELNLLVNMLRQKQHCLIFEPPKSGKRSIVQQAMMRLQKESDNLTPVNINLFNVRTLNALLKKLTNSLFAAFANTPSEWKELANQTLGEIPFTIVGNEFSNKKIHIEYNAELTQKQKVHILNLGQILAEKSRTTILIYFEEFQEINLHADSRDTFKLMEGTWAKQSDCTYLITGSFVNSMKEIFDEEKFFYNFAERIKLDPIDEKSFCEYIIKGFLKAGRVVSKELAAHLYRFTQGHPWYTQQVADIAFGLTKGYMTEQIAEQSFALLMELHSHRFHEITARLSLFQLNLLRAITDGVDKFSSAETLENYDLQSSANVNRLKDALQKKEVITIDKTRGTATFLDPLFGTWLKAIYFE